MGYVGFEGRGRVLVFYFASSGYLLEFLRNSRGFRLVGGSGGWTCIWGGGVVSGYVVYVYGRVSIISFRFAVVVYVFF